MSSATGPGRGHGLMPHVSFSGSLNSQVHPRSLSALQETVPGGRPAVGRRPPAVAQLQRKRGFRLAQTRQLFLLQRQKGHQSENVLHQQEPHHARPGEQVRWPTTAHCVMFKLPILFMTWNYQTPLSGPQAHQYLISCCRRVLFLITIHYNVGVIQTAGASLTRRPTYGGAAL